MVRNGRQHPLATFLGMETTTTRAERAGSATVSITVAAADRLACVDITPDIERGLAGAGITDGLCVIFCTHTTCSVLINEWEDGALDDLRRRLDAMFPADTYYAHDDPSRRRQNLRPDEPRNGHAHLAQMTMGGTSQVVPVVGGRLGLGRWQRVFLVELDHPRDRTVVVHFTGA